MKNSVEYSSLLKSPERLENQKQELEKQLRKQIQNAKEDFKHFKEEYSDKLSLSDYDRDQRAFTHSHINAILPYANVAIKRNMCFKILFEEKTQRENSEVPMEFIDGELRPSELEHTIPLSTEDAFRKYIQRAKKGIKEMVSHGLEGKESNNYGWTEILKNIVTLFAVGKTTKCSSQEIHDDLKLLIEDHPEILKKGIRLVNPSTIRAFISEEAKAYISFAKDNINDFRRKILGVLRFLPPSATLVKVGVDGYLFQTVCADDETQKPIQLLGEFINDLKTGANLGLAFGKTESNVTFRKAWKDFFKTTNNKVPREVAMDKHSAHNCSKTKNLNKIFSKKGVYLKRSSNPNNNSNLENCFLQVQEILGRVMQFAFIGSGITSTGENSRPCKIFQITMRKAHFLQSEAEMIHMLTYIVKECYNKQFLRANGLSRMQNYEKEESNHLTVLRDEEVAYATFEKHENKIIGCGVCIKKAEQLYLYKQRDIETATKHYRRDVNTYVDSDDRSSRAYIFQLNTRKFLLIMKGIAIVPCTIFDRTEEQKTWIRNYNKETRDLILEIQNKLDNMETNVEEFLDGADFRESQRAAKIKMEMDSAYLPAQIGMVQKTPVPIFNYSNSPKRFGKKTKGKSKEEAFREKFNL